MKEGLDLKHADYREHYRRDGEVFDFEEEVEPGHREANRRLAQEMLGLAGLKGDEMVLDIGCGSGWLIAALEKANPRGICGLDISRGQYLKAADPSMPRAPFVEGDAYYLPVRDESVDVVIMTEVLEHLDRPSAAVRDAARVLRRGGRLLVTVPAEEQIRYTLCIHCNRKTPINAHLHTFDFTKLKALLEDSGLLFAAGGRLLNKALIAARIHLLLKGLPPFMWRMLDRLAGLVLNRWTNICIRADKPV
jgi:ubiquinone/menaquinone biosynthesis C-methylase UbiE